MTDRLESVPLPVYSRSDLDRYVSLLAERFGDDLVSVVFYGSRARGRAKPESDVDLLIVARGLPHDRWERYKPFLEIAREVSHDFGMMVSLIVTTPEAAVKTKPYYLGMLSGHELLHDRAGFFAGVLERLQQRLRELGARRCVDPDGYEYSDLKPDWKPGDVVEL
jgi:predicted nucleotidyltransferase